MKNLKMMIQTILNNAIGLIPLPFRKTKLTVLRRFDYKGCPIYILQFYNVFLRLFIFKNEIYQNHAFMKAMNPIRYVRFMLGLADSPYGKEELEGGESAVINEAMNAIDALMKSGNLKKALHGKNKNKN